MNVLHIMNKLCFSGAEVMYVDAAPEFQALGCNLFVVNTSAELGEYAQTFEDAGYKVFHLPYPGSLAKKWKYYYTMTKLVKKYHIDVIHIHRSDMKWGMAFVAKMAGIKSLYTIHNCFVSRFFTKPYHVWLRWSAIHLLGCKFQSISDSVYDNERTYYHTATTLIYNWYGNKRFWPAANEERLSVRKELDVKDDTLAIVSVGGCSHVKRHNHIINILPKLLKDFPNVIYFHIGQGDMMAEEMALAKSLGVTEHIRFLGNQKNVRKYLIASDVYLMTSKYEGISITTIEALACKTPAILYNVPGLRDFNKDMQCSVLIEPSEENIPNAIKELMGNQQMRDIIIENGYRLVTSKFFLPKNVHKVYSLYIN